MEVERPKRRHRRGNGKSDAKDAERAARVILAGEAAGVPKSGDSKVEMIRALRSARRSAVKARVGATNLLKATLVTAPEALRWPLRGLPTKELVAVAARFRPGGDLDDVEAATRFALRSVARRHEALSWEIVELDARLELDLRRFRGVFKTEDSAPKGEHCHQQTRPTHRSFDEKLSVCSGLPRRSIPSPG
jgi:transposase